jgi:hypothetical protein
MATWEKTVLPNRIQVVGSPAHEDPIGYAALVGGHQVYGIWVDGLGFVKDQPTYGDPATYIDECPLLLGDNHCALEDASSAVADIFWTGCRSELCTGYIPEDDYWSPQMVEKWGIRNPGCTYTFIELSSPSSSPSPSEAP